MVKFKLIIIIKETKNIQTLSLKIVKYSSSSKKMIYHKIVPFKMIMLIMVILKSLMYLQLLLLIFTHFGNESICIELLLVFFTVYN